MLYKIHFIFAFTFLFILTACGPSQKQLDELDASRKQLEPSLKKLEAIANALPSRGTETEVSCKSIIPQNSEDDKTARDIITEDRLLAQFDKQLDANLIKAHDYIFNDRWFARLKTPKEYAELKDPSSVVNAIVNLRYPIETIPKITHVVVFRATELELGEIGEKDQNGVYEILQPAKLSGWVFIYKLDDTSLQTAFPVQVTSDANISFLKKQGKRPRSDVLIGDAEYNVKQIINNVCAN